MSEIVEVTELLADHGTVWTFRLADGRTIGVDHRPARDLAAALDTQGPVEAEVEGWQIVGVA